MNQAYAALLSSRMGLTTPGSPLVLLEDVWARVLLPLIDQTPGLLVVMDGMDRSTYAELRESCWSDGKKCGFRQSRHRFRWPPFHGDRCCRASLLCGKTLPGVRERRTPGVCRPANKGQNERPSYFTRMP